MMADSESDSDEWGTADLPDMLESKNVEALNSNENEEDWLTPVPPSTVHVFECIESNKNRKELSPNMDDGKNSMIIINMTKLSNGSIHSKFDANSVNDPQAVAQLRRKIENDYASYSKNIAYIGSGTVIPCGSSVWQEALVALRKDNSGQYFCPIFAPKAR